MEGAAPTLAAALAFSILHLAGPKLGLMDRLSREAWMSAAGGAAVAYVFLHLLPELGEHQGRVEEAGWLGEVDRHVYLFALAGLAAFYEVERLSRGGARGSRTDRVVFGVRLAAYGLYNALIGFLLIHREDATLRGLLVYTLALSVHFAVNDHALRAAYGRAYDRYGRWILAAAPLIGWGLGVVTDPSPILVAALFAFLAGGVVLNVLKEELPEERRGRFAPFVLGAGAFAVLLILTGG